MGSLNFSCDTQKPEVKTVKLKESACIEFIEDIPRFRGKFTFESQSSFNKVEKAATEFCLTHNIDRQYMSIISRLLAYNQHHYFAAFRQIPESLRHQFILQLSSVDIELIDSLSNHFIQKQKKQMNPYTTIGKKRFKLARSIDMNEISIQNKYSLKSEGLRLLKEGKVAIVIMLAGHSQSNYHTAKALKTLPLQQPCTVIQLMLKRLKKLLVDNGGEKELKSNDAIIPIILVCNEDNESIFKKYLLQKQYFGFHERWFKIASINKWPIVNEASQLCLSFQYKTLMWPEGTAKCLEVALSKRYKAYLNYHRIEYLHIMGCENIAEFPGDPILLGLTHKLNKKIAAKCIDPETISEEYPRYVSSESHFHLLNMKQLQFIDSLELIKKSPIALNSMVFHLQSLFDIAESFDEDLYMSRRYHLVEANQNYYDFLAKVPVVAGKCFAFQKDLRDYVSCSPESILIRYNRTSFFPISNKQSIDSTCKRYQDHIDTLRTTCLSFPVSN